jgi:hypothetical protein
MKSLLSLSLGRGKRNYYHFVCWQVNHTTVEISASFTFKASITKNKQLSVQDYFMFLILIVKYVVIFITAEVTANAQKWKSDLIQYFSFSKAKLDFKISNKIIFWDAYCTFSGFIKYCTGKMIWAWDSFSSEKKFEYSCLLIFFFIQSKQSVSPLNILPCFQASGVSSSKKRKKKEF